MSFLFASCADKPFFEEAQEITSQTWSYGDSVSFKVEVLDTAKTFDMHLNVDHTPDFDFQNLYLNVTTSFPKQDDKLERLNIDLAENNGKWIGKCNAEACKLKVYMLNNFKFADPGTYTFSFEQFSRKENLGGILGLGLQIFPHKEQSKK